jgi:hypothetical protein
MPQGHPLAVWLWALGFGLRAQGSEFRAWCYGLWTLGLRPRISRAFGTCCTAKSATSCSGCWEGRASDHSPMTLPSRRHRLRALSRTTLQCWLCVSSDHAAWKSWYLLRGVCGKRVVLSAQSKGPWWG